MGWLPQDLWAFGKKIGEISTKIKSRGGSGSQKTLGLTTLRWQAGGLWLAGRPASLQSALSPATPASCSSEKNAVWVPFYTGLLKTQPPKRQSLKLATKWHCKTIAPTTARASSRKCPLWCLQPHSLFLAIFFFFKDEHAFLKQLVIHQRRGLLWIPAWPVKNDPHQNIFLNWTSQRYLEKPCTEFTSSPGQGAFTPWKKKKIRMG